MEPPGVAQANEEVSPKRTGISFGQNTPESAEEEEAREVPAVAWGNSIWLE
jgi:hypothetical protein